MAYGEKWGALGDGTRRAVFEKLRLGPRAVGEIARGLPVSRPAVSQHLRVLKSAGLVRERRRGRRRLYSVDPHGLAELRAYVDGFWHHVLGEFAQAAEGAKDREEDHGGES